ncbi:hypothetical protein [Flavobacterium sp.]|uniref:hypothetical protein n=1 Tax=Flavobacterium sp. TaxID=239 RepID=UPI0038FC1918
MENKRNTHKEFKERWIFIKNELKEYSSVDLFQKVYLIYNERIENRYFKPIELLRNNKDSCDGFGFSMVAISCSLIEFLQSTIDGKFDKLSYKNEFMSKYPILVSEGLIDYYGGKSGDEFVKFLKELNSRFKEKSNYISNFDSVAKEFYKCVRCTLLHDACTRNNWIIREESDDDTIFDNSNKEEKILYRNNFYELIKNKVNFEMRDQFLDKDNTELRKNLLKKMDVIFETANYGKKEDIPFWWN